MIITVTTMKSQERKNRKLNLSLTKKVIELHAKGYHYDYLLLCNQQLLCVQNDHAVPATAVHIQVVDQCYDPVSRTFKYVHTIDTGNGEMGVMVAETIVTNSAII
jgi:hypothetical protein